MKKMAIVVCLTFVVLMVAIGCAPESGAVPQAPAIATEAPSAPADVTEAPAVVIETPGAPNPPGKPFAPDAIKPPLSFSQPVEGVGEQIIAYTFPAGTPNWTVPLKAAPLSYIEPTTPETPPGTLTRVGVVEIGAGSSTGVPEPGIYVVAIDLVSSEPVVSGRLLPLTASNEYGFAFIRTLQTLNPERLDRVVYEEFRTPDPPPDYSVAISAGGVCFVVKTDIPNDDPDQGPVYIRYCSEPGSILSVIVNFEEQYKTLSDSIFRVAESFGLQIQGDQIISEMEHPERLVGCAEKTRAKLVEEPQEVLQETCGSDITVAPVTEYSFYQKYDEAKSQSGLPNSRFLAASALSAMLQSANPFPVPVAAVQILQPIDTSLGRVQPGNYQMDYWFDQNEIFYSATIKGVTIDNLQVIDQQVPAVPATFVNTDGSQQPGAQISTCRIFGRCAFFQRTCP